MNYAVIFAGGAGTRMHSKSKPKQFLELNGKPIIIYTLEIFDSHPSIDGIFISCIQEWIPFLERMLRKFEIQKVIQIVPGGNSGQESIYNGLCAVERNKAEENPIVIIHDAVRPLITKETITDNINMVKECGNCITCVPAYETLIVRQKDGSIEVPIRKNSFIAKAPQSFYLNDIISTHRKAINENKNSFTDSCTLMSHYGFKFGFVNGPFENIKITTPTDFYTFRAMIELKENQQIFGF